MGCLRWLACLFQARAGYKKHGLPAVDEQVDKGEGRFCLGKSRADHSSMGCLWWTREWAIPKLGQWWAW